ncbi:PAS domain S-box protein [Desulfopila sp. IMCC35008]|uniref:PAS domain-containing protein n=1 Tax=Desulfopila sp. IMCC35008 TaxID=2653858 RepID=UPI0013D3D460|nr:PAS domain S-box protein [Desulfopila sp. IMCC35008]
MQNKPSYEELEIRVQKLEKTLVEQETVSNELEKDRTWFKFFYEKAPLGYQSLDRNGNFLEVNKAWLDLLGYSREEVIGKSFGDFLHPEWRDHFKKNFPRFKAVGEVLGVEFEIARKNGTYILVSFNGKIGKNAEGDFLQTHCIFRNITEEKKIEEQLKRSEERYRLLFDESINPIVIYNHRSILFWPQNLFNSIFYCRLIPIT